MSDSEDSFGSCDEDESGLIIQPYTEKSFLVYDPSDSEGTRKYKDSLKGLGGKYGASFTWDSSGRNQECTKRSAYMFPNTRKDKVKKWIDGGCDSVEVVEKVESSARKCVENEGIVEILKKLASMEKRMLTMERAQKEIYKLLLDVDSKVEEMS